jgi:antibiotic biosynthesis monooxygenase (ABM) superfamily enzyme
MSGAMANAGVSTNKPTPALFRWEASMTAFNVVRFRVKPGREQEFLDAHQPQNVRSKWPGWKRVDVIKTGDRSYCVIGEWEDMAAMAIARPNLIATLNSFSRYA